MRRAKVYKSVKLLCQKCGGPIYLTTTQEKQNPKKEPPHCPYCGMEVGKVDVPPMKVHGSWHKYDRVKETS